MDYLKRAHELAKGIVGGRGFLHQYPEIGCDISVAKAFVENKLKCMGYEVAYVDPGPVAMAGHGSPVILLRADIDELLMEEEGGLFFASVNPGKVHCCDHGNHTAMLLRAAKALKENKADPKGMVKLIFQPGGETENGAQEMVDGGLLESPRPGVIMVLHVDTLLPLKKLDYSRRPAFCSSDVSETEVMGKVGHGTRPYQAVDTINASAHIITGLGALISRECTPTEIHMLTVRSIESDTKAFSIFPQMVTMTGSIRTYNIGQEALLVRRLREVVDGISKTFNCTSKVAFGHQNDPLIMDNQTETEMWGYPEGVLGDEVSAIEPPIMKMGSEDFISVTIRVPSAYLYIDAGPNRENSYFCSQHNAKVRFNEEMLPYDAVGFTNCAARWLENHSK